MSEETNEVREVLMIHSGISRASHEGKATVPKDFNFVPRLPTAFIIFICRILNGFALSLFYYRQ